MTTPDHRDGPHIPLIWPRYNHRRDMGLAIIGGISTGFTMAAVAFALYLLIFD